MKGSISVFVSVAKNWFRSKSGVFFSFMFPLLLLLIFGTIFGGGGGQEYNLYVQNNDVENGQPTQLSTGLIGTLNRTGALNIEDIPSDVDVETYLEEHASFSSDRALIIPENFQRKALINEFRVRVGVIIDTLGKITERFGGELNENQIKYIENGKIALESLRGRTSMENVRVTLLVSEGDTAGASVRGIISGVMSGFNNQLIGSEPVIETSTEDMAETEELDPVDYYLPGYIAAFIMANGIIGLTSNVSEFRRNGVIKRLSATPLRKSSWILGNLLHQAILAFMLTLLMVGVGWVIFGVQAIPGAYAILLILLGSFSFCGIGMVLGGLIEDTEAASAAGNAIGFPMMFLSGAFWPIEMMPGFMQTVAKFMPVYHFHEGLRSVMIPPRDPGDALGSFIVLGILAVVFVLLAVRVTRWKE